MRILVGNNRLHNAGGSETYTYALVAELLRQGHKVECVASGKPGIVARKIAALGVPIHFRPISGRYDLALLSHTSSIAMVKDVRAFKIQTCHGIFHKLEQPVRGMNKYVGISSEVVQHLESKGFKATCIYNGVDCERFKPVRPVSEKLGVVLSLAHSSMSTDLAKRACEQIGCDFIVRNKYTNSTWDVEDEINQADLVIGLGRGVYEAAACGRNVIIFDHRPYMGKYPMGDGFLKDNNFHAFLSNNCSGRYSGRKFVADDVHRELKKYDLGMGLRLREFVLENLNIEKQVEKYLLLAK